MRLGRSCLFLVVVVFSPNGLAGEDRPNGAPAISVLSTYSLTIATRGAGERLFAYSNRKGGWDRYDVPKGVSAKPILASDVAALQLEGERIFELAAFSPRTGRWHRCPLRSPTSQACKPAVSAFMVCYHVDGVAYAFSPRTGTWDSIDSAAFPQVSADAASIQEPDRIVIFSDAVGKWCVLKATDFDEPAHQSPQSP